MSRAPTYMSLSDGVNNSLDMYKTMSPTVSDIPDWIKECAVRAPESMKPLLDIYAEVLRVHERIARMELVLDGINIRLYTPWYMRLSVWFKSFFTRS